MELIKLTKENLEKEHICCAISNNNDIQVASKKAWLREQFDEGLVFLKGNVRGKCFIEYIPAERAWAPVHAAGYMYINCLWVSGQFKGCGYSTQLLDECIRDSKEKGKKGLVTLSSAKKRPFLSDPDFLRHKGFKHADSAPPYFELMYLPFDESAEKPQFSERAKNPDLDSKGITIIYTNQCPFTAKYIPILEKVAKEHGVLFEAVRFRFAEHAQGAFSPFSSFSLYYNGEFVTHEILSDKKFEKFLAEKGL